ncbi:5'-3' exonuclease [Nymphon striatum]|nr:5'-3' exonuclease [Nymphon striatum]
MLDEKKIEKRFGAKPSQIADQLAIAGDKSDNIPGVPGVGMSTAAEDTRSKSPLTLLLLIGIMVISTLVVISNYFLRPSLELNIKDEVSQNLKENGFKSVKVKVEGRDVLLEGFIFKQEDSLKVENVMSRIQGIHQIDNQLVVKNQTNE